MTILQIAALLYLLIYYGILLGFRSFLLYKNTGINPVTNMEKKGMEGFIEKVFQFCFVLVSVIVLNFVFIEVNYVYYLAPFAYLELSWLGYVGIILSAVGLIFAIIAQLQMGDSWRLGLNKNEKTTLVKSKLFEYTRNPIYLGLLVSYVGFFLMMPNAFSLTFLVVSYIALEIKIRLEEQYLIDKHDQDYLTYHEIVRRWV